MKTGNAIELAAAVIRKRIAELRQEEQRLERALRDLAGLNQEPSKRVNSQTPQRKAGARPRARRGERPRQFLATVRTNPGAPVAVLAKEMGVAPQQLYPIAKRLTAAGEVVKDGKGYSLASQDRNAIAP